MGFPESKLNNIFIEIYFDWLRMPQEDSVNAVIFIEIYFDSLRMPQEDSVNAVIFIEIYFDWLRMLQGDSRQCSKWIPFPTLSVSKGEPWWPWGLMSSVDTPPPRRLADPSLCGLAFQTLWGLSHPDSPLFLLFSLCFL